MPLDPLALYGALTGTLALAIEASRYLRERPRLKIDVISNNIMFPAAGEWERKDSDTYTRLAVTNLGRDTIAVSHAFFVSLRDGKAKMLLLRDSVDSPRVLTPESPRAEYVVTESAEFDPRTMVYVGLSDGFGKHHGRWLVEGRSKRSAQRIMKESGLAALLGGGSRSALRV